MPKLDVQKALQYLQPGGLISQSLKGFESRTQQQNMMQNIIEAYNQNQIALIEAGTGTGKSMAYLIPAMLWALQHKERTVISTHTINLQEQLLHKDIPILLKAMGVELKAVLVKGMRNYVCLRKMEELKAEQLLLPPDEAEQFSKLEAWSHSTKDGSRASLPFEPAHALWDKTCAESDTCTKSQCPFYDNCHFFKARREAAEAQILIVNHHLLFADLATRADTDNYSDPSILPIYTKVVVDEAHHIEDIATEYFAERVNQLDLLRIIGRLAAEKGTTSLGKLSQLKNRLVECFKTKTPPDEITSIFNRLNIDLPATRTDLLKLITDGFDKLHRFISLASPASRNQEDSSDNKLRMLPYHYTHPYWKEDIKRHFGELTTILKKYVQIIASIENSLKGLNHDQLNEQTKGIRFEIEALSRRLTNACEILTQFIDQVPPPSKVRWIEAQLLKSFINVNVTNAELDVAQALVNYLFSKFDSVILCSATLTTNNKFDFVKQRLGLLDTHLEDLDLSENIYESPFDYKKQALLAIPKDIPNPLESHFIPAAVQKIEEAIKASRGNAFVLFTSYSMLKTCYDLLAPKLQEQRFTLFKQGDHNRQTLLTKFKETNHSVLFGTDSFWEGVDVAGDALRCVIIVKLPFKVPTEPITQARAEAILAKGGDPFMEYSLPNAIVKFKQGFGRLIRNKNDRGCIICLDTRLLTKRYGQQFLDSLPPCQQIFTAGELQSQMQEFYKKTYHLIKS